MEDAPQLTDESADAVFRHWELLRIVYNAMLAIVLIPWFGSLISDLKFTTFVIECAIAANLAFCVGHVAEGYISMIGAPRQTVRYALFVLGALLSIALELACIAHFQHQFDL